MVSPELRNSARVLHRGARPGQLWPGFYRRSPLCPAAIPEWRRRGTGLTLGNHRYELFTAIVDALRSHGQCCCQFVAKFATESPPSTMIFSARFLIYMSRRPSSHCAAASARMTTGRSSSSSIQISEVLQDGVGRLVGGFACVLAHGLSPAAR